MSTHIFTAGCFALGLALIICAIVLGQFRCKVKLEKAEAVAALLETLERLAVGGAWSLCAMGYFDFVAHVIYRGVIAG